MGAAALAFRKVRQKIGLEKKKDNDSSDTTAAKADTTSTDSAATGSPALYDGTLSDDAVAKAKKKASAGTMADEGEQTFGGGALGA